MTRRRRQFLFGMMALTGITAGGGFLWLRNSRRGVARFARQLVNDARRTVPQAPVKPKPESWADNKITICWLGHATVLINFYGVRIVTDPVLGNRIGVALGLGTVGPKRYIAPALRFHELPRIDLVLLSHAHMDHMDVATLSRFPKGTPVVSARATSDVLSGTRLSPVTELRWNESTTVRCPKGEIEIAAFEVKHWGQRWPKDIARGYNGYVLRREGKSLLFGGDTAQTPLFSGLRGRGPYEAAIMPIGAYRPWIWNHCTPEQAFEMAAQAGARYLVPVHHQTFRLSDEPMTEPVERIAEAMQREPERLALRRVGESFVCPT
jgi:L-ascorbate metabolism protein UlaG (beta-lactamase superfamily)